MKVRQGYPGPWKYDLKSQFNRFLRSKENGKNKKNLIFRSNFDKSKTKT